ncbi:MAG: nucleotide sugar dehydrogenase [Verrucomicrobiota bacterium JB022]|nr:nucleotide sugar dehydrogenase [Verrucomicrobiota bacterium JB022]
MEVGEQAAFTSVSIIGMGYVGLPLALQFARAGLNVNGVDIDDEKVERLNKGESYIKHIASASLQEQLDNERFQATNDFSSIAETEAVIICVPTPLNKNHEPDLTYVLATGRSIAPHIRPGQLIILESTTYPGTTDDELRPILEEGSGLVAGRDFCLAFSPEREDPGNPLSQVGRIPKVVGGISPSCTQRACALYGTAIEKTVPVSSCRVAEATKLLENIFRSVNIALVNELKIVYEAMGIDIWEVIDAAKTKPFGFMPFYPGPGLGGHCIPIDPYYLSWKAREYNQFTRFISLAGETNTQMPRYVLQRCMEALNGRRKAISGSKVLILGLAYKPNVDDMRESPSLELMDLFRGHGAEVSFYDPHIPVVPKTREHPEYTGWKSIEWKQDVLQEFDLVLIATNHQSVDYQELANWTDLIVDTRNAMHGCSIREGQLFKS